MSKRAGPYVKMFTHGGNNCNQTFTIIGNESFTSLWKKCGPLFITELF